MLKEADFWFFFHDNEFIYRVEPVIRREVFSALILQEQLLHKQEYKQAAQVSRRTACFYFAQDLRLPEFIFQHFHKISAYHASGLKAYLFPVCCLVPVT